MDPLLVPYGFNIIVLVPVGLLTLLGGATGNRWVFHGKFPESSGVRTILGSLWTSILAGSCLGLRFPTVMAPLLLIQVAYKSLWLVVFVLPRLLTGRGREVPWGVTTTFLAIVVSYPWVIPWERLFGSP
jgi:hypothetical protein